MNCIKKCRESKGLSQKYVAISLGVKAPSISDWENGKTNPTLENLIALSKLLDVSCDELLGLQELRDTPGETAAASSDLGDDEMQLLQNYRNLNAQGQAYIRQTMFMALSIYKRRTDVSGVETEISQGGI